MLSWGGAKTACQNWNNGNGYLFVVNDGNEYTSIRTAFNNYYFWIAWKQAAGADGPGTGSATASWSTTIAGHTSPYTNWYPGEPNNGFPGQCGAADEDCAVGGREDGDPRWNDDDCDCEYFFVCETDP